MINDSYDDREQSAAKHQILERYLKAFTPIVGTWADEIVYVDCLAGPWNSKNADLSDTSFHRALTVLRDVKSHGRCKRVRALLIENNPSRYERLKQYTASLSDIEAIAEPWNFEDSIQKVVQFVRDTDTPKGRVFPFVFIDPWGWELVTIDHIRPLLLLDPGEVLITFMSSFVNRFLSDPSKPFERLLGHSEVCRLRELHGDDLEDELVRSYANAVRTVGNYEFSCAVPVLDPKRDRFLFHMIFATRNMKGVEEFKEAERNMIEVMHQLRAEAQQRRALEAGSSGFLFEPLATYREDRFSRFRTNAMTAASIAIETKLKTGGRLFIQELLNVGLQHSAVLKEDIYDLVSEWLNERRLVLRGVSPRQRVLRPENVVEWIQQDKDLTV